jgi:hypothetical protein
MKLEFSRISHGICGFRAFKGESAMRGDTTTSGGLYQRRETEDERREIEAEKEKQERQEREERDQRDRKKQQDDKP